MLPDNTVYSFIGFVTGSNLAPILLNAAKSTTLAKEQIATVGLEDKLKISLELTGLKDLALIERELGKLHERVLELREKTGNEERSHVLDKISVDESGS